MSSKPPRNAVYLLSVGEDFNPQRPWDLPNAVLGAELFAKNLPWLHALGFARTYNKHQLQGGLATDRKWAIACRHTRYVWQKGDQQ